MKIKTLPDRFFLEMRQRNNLAANKIKDSALKYIVTSWQFPDADRKILSKVLNKQIYSIIKAYCSKQKITIDNTDLTEVSGYICSPFTSPDNYIENDIFNTRLAINTQKKFFKLAYEASHQPLIYEYHEIVEGFVQTGVNFDLFTVSLAVKYGHQALKTHQAFLHSHPEFQQVVKEYWKNYLPKLVKFLLVIPIAIAIGYLLYVLQLSSFDNLINIWCGLLITAGIGWLINEARIHSSKGCNITDTSKLSPEFYYFLDSKFNLGLTLFEQSKQSPKKGNTAAKSIRLNENFSSLPHDHNVYYFPPDYISKKKRLKPKDVKGAIPKEPPKTITVEFEDEEEQITWTLPNGKVVQYNSAAPYDVIKLWSLNKGFSNFHDYIHWDVEEISNAIDTNQYNHFCPIAWEGHRVPAINAQGYVKVDEETYKLKTLKREIGNFRFFFKRAAIANAENTKTKCELYEPVLELSRH